MARKIPLTAQKKNVFGPFFLQILLGLKFYFVGLGGESTVVFVGVGAAFN